MFRSTSQAADRWPGNPEEEQNENDELYSCDRCSDGDWFSETEVEVHRQTTHKKELCNLINGNYERICKMCIQAFEDKTKLIKHIKSDHLLSSEDATRVEREIFICDECHSVFFNKKHLAVHIVYYHYRIRGPVRVECPKCQKYIKMGTLWFHFQVHKFQSVASCKICFQKCKNRQHLKEHVKTHAKYLVCGICQYETKKEELFKQHLATKHRNNSAFACSPRPYFVPKLEEAKITKISCFHGLSLTNGVRVCVLCREICVSDSEMQDHIKEHMVVEKRTPVSHFCECGERFLNKVLLKHHIFKLKGIHKEKDVTSH